MKLLKLNFLDMQIFKWPPYNRQYIDTLIECEQKMVISEYVVQQYLKEIWNGQVSDIWNGEDSDK